jgi:hypothetical protein
MPREFRLPLENVKALKRQDMAAMFFAALSPVYYGIRTTVHEKAIGAWDLDLSHSVHGKVYSAFAHVLGP